MRDVQYYNLTGPQDCQIFNLIYQPFYNSIYTNKCVVNGVTFPTYNYVAICAEYNDKTENRTKVYAMNSE